MMIRGPSQRLEAPVYFVQGAEPQERSRFCVQGYQCADGERRGVWGGL